MRSRASLIGLNDTEHDWQAIGDISFEQLQRSTLAIRTSQGFSELPRQAIYVLVHDGRVLDLQPSVSLAVVAELFDDRGDGGAEEKGASLVD